MLILLILLAILVVAVLAVTSIHNGLATARNGHKNAFVHAHVDGQLQRRFDLTPNPVETARACLQHERETLDAVIDARAPAQSGKVASARQAFNDALMACNNRREVFPSNRIAEMSDVAPALQFVIPADRFEQVGEAPKTPF